MLGRDDGLIWVVPSPVTRVRAFLSCVGCGWPEGGLVRSVIKKTEVVTQLPSPPCPSEPVAQRRER